MSCKLHFNCDENSSHRVLLHCPELSSRLPMLAAEITIKHQTAHGAARGPRT